MRLVEVTVSNFRSIGTLTRFEIDSLTTLIGPNNEGKSNLLRALALGMRLLRTWSELPEEITKTGEITGARISQVYDPYGVRRRTDQTWDISYQWQADFPLHLQTSRSPRPTEIRLKFRLDDEERDDFTKTTGLKTNGDLPIRLLLSRTTTSIGILKQGRGAETYKANAHIITKFIADRVSHVLIPAVRTIDQAMDLLNELANIRLRALATSKAYRTALQKVNELRDAAVAVVQEDLQASISSYLPSVKSVEIPTRAVQHSGVVRQVMIDDGSPTSLAQKGDGVKSLFSLALIQHLARERASDKENSFILLVDEPEAHLHARAVHDLQTLFSKLARSQQVVLATHNPIFVNRDYVAANIIVQRNSASPALGVKQIRETLGVQLQDNLDSAEIVILTEGWTDAHVLPEVYKRASKRAQTDLRTGRVVFKSTTGAGKMRAQILRERSTACRLLVVLDGDATGDEQAQRLVDEGLLELRNIFILRGKGRKSSEIEDLINPQVYLGSLSKKFGRTFTTKHFSSMNRKWSDSFTSAAGVLGLSGSQSANLKTAKMTVADAVRSSDLPLIRESAEDGVEALRSAIWSS
ncbi:ATP-dependent nuclease [Mycolicibacterium wolinskyi]|nr:ATP-binding protein [Mycolicibacterium wolinskyi]